MSFGGGGDPRGVRSEINVTPLVDVCLVLLIIFMVVTPMLQRGIDVKLPEAANLIEGKGGDPLQVGIKEDGSIWLEKVEVKKEELALRLKETLDRQPAARLVVKADNMLEYALVRQVMVALQEAGATRVSLAASQTKEQP